MIPDELFMQRAIDLAGLGTGHVSPNPKVGCLLVAGQEIIGEGWHRQYGSAHAEVNAIDGVSDKSRITGSTAYVNLEPCSHFGKTPPCADLLIEHRIKRVVVANPDPNPLVAGKGIKKLLNAGIEVVTGVLEKEGRILNIRFFTTMERKRPFVILKWAQSADGFIAKADYESPWISNDYSRQLVHLWRSEEDAVLVGTGTASHDNPRLNVRNWTGRNPIRIVFDRFLKLPATLHLFDATQRTICYNVLKSEEQKNLQFIQLDELEFIPQVISNLFNQHIQSVIVEGGAKTLQLFIDSGNWDEARIFSSPHSFGSGIEAPRLKGNLVSVQQIFSDELKIFAKGDFYKSA